jgi:hypothetical protein
MKPVSDKKHICTCFDFNFLPRGLALYKSLARFHADFVFYVLAFDNETYDYLTNLKYDKLIVVSPDIYNKYFETGPDKYSDKKQYFFSATPNLCLYIFEKYPEVDLLLYLDADVYAFSALGPLYNELGDYSIAICSHRFHPLFDLLSKNYGRFNVAVNFFRRNEEGLKCLNDWKKDCDSWYPGKPDYPLKFFSDQIFLDEWVNRYHDIKIIQNIGVDVAPWNVANYKFSEKDGSYFIDGKPLIIFHFSSLRKISDSLWNGNTIYFFGSIKGALRSIYKDYISEIESFGLDNSKLTYITHSDSQLKRIFYFFMKLVLNENIAV